MFYGICIRIHKNTKSFKLTQRKIVNNNYNNNDNNNNNYNN